MTFSLVSPATRCVTVFLFFFLFFLIASLSGLDISLLLVEFVIIFISASLSLSLSFSLSRAKLVEIIRFLFQRAHVRIKYEIFAQSEKRGNFLRLIPSRAQIPFTSQSRENESTLSFVRRSYTFRDCCENYKSFGLVARSFFALQKLQLHKGLADAR